MSTEKEWTTESGLKAKCLIVRNSHRCGYVEVPKSHPLYEHDYSESAECLHGESPDCHFSVHGGVTYSGNLGHKGRWWVGFDCAHTMDGYMAGSPLAIAGFNNGPVRSLEYVEAECENLAKQLKEIA